MKNEELTVVLEAILSRVRQRHTVVARQMLEALIATIQPPCEMCGLHFAEYGTRVCVGCLPGALIEATGS